MRPVPGSHRGLRLVAAGLATAVVVAAAIVFGPRWIASSGRIDVSEAELAVEGAPLYAENCASCHGANLEGQPNWRRQLPTGGLPAPPHDETGHTWHHPDQQLLEITKFGGQSLAPPGFQSNMPAFGERLSDRQITAILAFIRSRWPQSIQDRQRRLSERARSSP